MNRTLFDDQPDSAPTKRPAKGSGEKAAGPPASGPAPDRANSAPLADRMRPLGLDEIIGQDKVVGERAFLRRAIVEDRVPSLILWGPPGSGKTTIAEVMARQTSSRFVPFSAVTSGIKEVKNVMADAERLRRAQAKRTLLFVDEIHRFNRAQQDAFLPYVERGDIILVGATTENPSFELNGALISRCRVVVLAPLSIADLIEILTRALHDRERGLGRLEIALQPEALEAIAQLASGDARRALNLLELVVEDAAANLESEPDAPSAREEVTAETVRAIAQKKILLYDKAGEEHYNLISALHKSLRESDPDAALYWLARMLASGEDPLFLARRMVRFASEDVGLAEPRALGQTLAAWDAYHRLGSPEGELALAQAAVYLALAPKSNAVYESYKAVGRAVEERPAEPVPMAIRNAPTRLMKETGYGAGHVYAHATEEGIGGMDCLPEALSGCRFYLPTSNGFEGELARRLERFRDLRRCARERSAETPAGSRSAEPDSGDA